jgi:hypothetical protein
LKACPKSFTNIAQLQKLNGKKKLLKEDGAKMKKREFYLTVMIKHESYKFSHYYLTVAYTNLKFQEEADMIISLVED